MWKVLLVQYFLSLIVFSNGLKDGTKIFRVPDTDSDLDSRIVNGSSAHLGQFPQQVSLRRSWSDTHFCGGSIIDLRWVVTAAHCMFLRNEVIKPWTITVVAGDVFLNRSSQTQQECFVKKIIVHEKFDMNTLENDIALLQLKTPFVTSLTVSVARLQKFPIKSGTICQVMGWGYPSEHTPVTSNELMYVNLPILSQKTCRRLLHQISLVSNGMFCAGYIEGGRDACKGDSGSGMVCNGTLTGIVSGGKGCARPRLPGLYTNLTFYSKWIEHSQQAEEILNRFSRSEGVTKSVCQPWLIALSFLSFFLRIFISQS